MLEFKIDDNPSLRSFLAAQNENTIRKLVGSKVYLKGMDYFLEDAVEEIRIKDENTLVALVSGHDLYQVEIKAKDSEISASCSCPYGEEWEGVCKHIAAALIEATKIELWQELPLPLSNAQTSEIEKSFEKWLRHLPAETLQKYVLEFAPASFRKEMGLRHASSKLRKGMLLNITKNISESEKKIFENYNWTGYEATNKQILEDFKFLWMEFPKEACNIFVQLINITAKVLDSEFFETGYEYGEEPAGFEFLDDYIELFLKDLPEDLRNEAGTELLGAVLKLDHISAMDFPTLLFKPAHYLKPQSWQQLKDSFSQSQMLRHKNFAKEFYDFFAPAMTDKKEKRQLLEMLAKQHKYFILPLFDLYASEENTRHKAAGLLDEIIKEWLQSGEFFTPDEYCEAILQKRIRLARQLKEPLSELLFHYLYIIPKADSLLFCLKYIPEKRNDLEQFLKKRKLAEYARYLEMENRLEEVIELMEKMRPPKKSHHIYYDFLPNYSRYKFFVRHKKKFTTKALDCFWEKLDADLLESDKFHYKLVVDTLKNIKPLLHPEEFTITLHEIYTRYKRRPKLIDMIRDAFSKGR